MVDLDKLDKFLMSDASPDHAMQLSDLDGFLTGILCSPKLIEPSEWLPIVWGTKAPAVKDIDTYYKAIEAVLARYNEIADGLNSDPPTLEPIFWQAPEGHTIAMDWCEGFMQAVHLRQEMWSELLDTKKGRDLMFPIVAHLFDDEGNSIIGTKQEDIDALLGAAAEEIPENVPLIFDYWRSRRNTYS
jgi:uncharacterized protein